MKSFVPGLFAIDFSNYLVSSIMHFHINLVSQTNKQTNKQTRTNDERETTRPQGIRRRQGQGLLDDNEDNYYRIIIIRFYGVARKVADLILQDVHNLILAIVVDTHLTELLPSIGWFYRHLTDPVSIGREVEAWLDPTLFRRINEIFCGLRQLWTEGFKEELIKLGKEQQFDILRLMPGCTTTCTKLDTAVAVTDDYARITRSRKRLKYRSNFILIFKCPNFRIDNNLN
jgi:hypothetical protein